MSGETLINGYLDETLTPEQLAELEDWINTDPLNAKRFAAAIYLDEQLQAELSLKQFTEEKRDKIVVPDFQRSPWGMIAALAASLLVGLFFWSRQSADQPVPAFATVVQVVDAKWENDKPVEVGDRISARTLHLLGGIVHLRFDSGVGVTLKGPAEFEVSSVELTRLQSGVLTATVPPGAEGFTVDTPSALVVDLGTAFGIEQFADGSSKVSVFDGEVEIVSPKDKRLLTEGRSVQLATDGSVSDLEFATRQFEKLWPTASGITGSTGAFRFAPQWPRPLNRIESDTNIFILPEGYAKELDAPFPIDIAPGESDESLILAGERVRSYLLQFNQIDQATVADRKLRRIEGSITFDRPVLGLIIRSETLEQTDGLFSLRGGRVPPFKRGLELSPPRVADEVILSKDGRTVTLKLTVFNRLSDHVRVIVDASLRWRD